MLLQRSGRKYREPTASTSFVVSRRIDTRALQRGRRLVVCATQSSVTRRHCSHDLSLAGHANATRLIKYRAHLLSNQAAKLKPERPTD